MDIVSAATTSATQSAESIRSSFGVAAVRQSIQTERETVERLLAPPAPGTGTLVDKLA
jgi:hypothetical protein